MLPRVDEPVDYREDCHYGKYRRCVVYKNGVSFIEQVPMDIENSLMFPDVTGTASGMQKITVAKTAQPTTMELMSHPNLPRLNRLFLGRYRGARRRHMRRAAGKAKEMSSAIMAEPIKTLNANT